MLLLLLRSARTLVSMLSLIDFSYIIRCREELVDFLIKHGVLISTITCDKCGNVLNINKETLLFHCNRRYTMKNAHKKRVSMKCNFTKSEVLKLVLGSKSHLEIATICKIVVCFLMLRHPRHDDTLDETGVASATIVDWFNFCREVIIIFQ